MEEQEVDIILQFVKIMMEIGIPMMIQMSHLLQKKKFVPMPHIFYFIEERTDKNTNSTFFMKNN